MDFINMLSSIPAGVYTLLGTALGFFLNFFYNRYENRNQIDCVLQIKEPYKDWNYSKEPKYGYSGYIIEIYNSGRNPVWIEYMRLKSRYGLIDMLFRKPKLVMPYHKCKHDVMKQDYEALLHWCQKDIEREKDWEAKMSEKYGTRRKVQRPVNRRYRITAFTVNGKEITRYLDVTMIDMNARAHHDLENGVIISEE